MSADEPARESLGHLLRVIADRVEQGLTPPEYVQLSGLTFDVSWHDVPRDDLTAVLPWVDVFRCDTKTDLTRNQSTWTEWHGSLPGGGHSVRVTAFYRPDGGETR